MDAFIAAPQFVPGLIVTAGLMLMMVTAAYGVARNSSICVSIIMLFAVAMISLGLFAFHAFVPGGTSFEILLFGVALGGFRGVLLLRRRHLASAKADTADRTP